MKRRYKIVRHYRAYRRTMDSEAEAARATAERFGLGRSTLRRYKRLYDAGGKRALLPRYQLDAPAPSTALPITSPAAQLALSLRAHLGWCGQRIADELRQRRLAEVSHMAVYRLFRRYRVPVRAYHPVGKRYGIRFRKQRVRAPNWTWHVDFAGPLEDAQGQKRSVLIVIDSYSRMLLACEVTADQKAETVERVLGELFERHGKPQVVITDNGRCFAPPKPGYDHRFARFMAEHGVEHRRTRPYYPQTNGKAEAMVKTFKRECLGQLGSGWVWSQVEQSEQAFRAWYNFYRSHGGLGYQVPSALYMGVKLPRVGLSNLFGFLPESAVEMDVVPEVTKATRAKHLALLLVS
jgi:transposase InsO family protein